MLGNFRSTVVELVKSSVSKVVRLYQNICLSFKVDIKSLQESNEKANVANTTLKLESEDTAKTLVSVSEGYEKTIKELNGQISVKSESIKSLQNDLKEATILNGKQCDRINELNTMMDDKNIYIEKLTKQHKNEINKLSSDNATNLIKAAKKGKEEAIKEFELKMQALSSGDKELAKKVLASTKQPSKGLTDDEVRDIRRRGDAGEKHKDIGAIYNLGRSTITRIVNGESYRNVK